jgi:uncharacterized protein YegP (UPF0339 family)
MSTEYQIGQSSFVIFQDKQLSYQFHLLSFSGEILLESDKFKVKQACVSAIVGCKLQSSSDRNFQRLKSKSGAYYFNLRLKNREILARSQDHGSHYLREMVIDTIKEVIKDSFIEDQSVIARP